MIALSQVDKRFGAVTAVGGLSLELPQGSVTIVHGPSGSGKTTLLRLIAGLEMPDGGQIVIDGRMASTPQWILPPNRRGIGFVFQTPSLWPHMTVSQNILFGLHGVRREDKSARLQQMIQEMSLGGLEHRFPAQLSGGQARRVSLARSLITRPRRLLLDEPLINMDPELRSRLLALILDIVGQEGASLLYVTHNLEEVDGLSGRVLCLQDGRIAPE
jgi:iron(III) transport system ATP-binding protein